MAAGAGAGVTITHGCVRPWLHRVRDIRPCAGRVMTRLHWVRDREAVDLKQPLGAVLRVEPLLVCLASLLTVIAEALRVSLCVGDRLPESGGIAGPEQHTVNLGGDQLGE